MEKARDGRAVELRVVLWLSQPRNIIRNELGDNRDLSKPTR
eukprot:COSAG02_NODE_43266_length_376_cov_0.996390_1_plen_40_part_10